MRLLHCNMVSCLVTWQARKAQSTRARYAYEMRALARATMRAATFDIGVQQLYRVMTHLLHGVKGTSVAIWKQHTVAAAHEAGQVHALAAQSREARAKLEAGDDAWRQKVNVLKLRSDELSTGMRHERIGAGVQISHQVLLRWVYGATGSMLLEWKHWVVQMQLIRDQQEQRRSLSLPLLKSALHRIAKGKLAMLFKSWSWNKAQAEHQFELDVMQSAQHTLTKMTNQSLGLQGIDKVLRAMTHAGVSHCLAKMQRHKNESKERAFEEFSATLRFEYQVASKRAGMSQMQQILARMVKGKVLVCLRCWQAKQFADQVELELETTQFAFGTGLKIQSQRAAARMFRGMSTRLRGAASRRLLQHWSYNVKLWQASVRAALQSEMRHLGQRAGLERMQSVLTGMVNTSIRAQLKAWHMAALRARMEAKQMDLEACHRSEAKQNGIQQLGSILVRQMNGFQGACLIAWQKNHKEHGFRSVLKSAGLRGIAAVLARLALDRARECFTLWHLNQLSDADQFAQDVIRSALETQVKFENQATGLTQLRHVMQRFVQSTGARLIKRWRQKLRDHCWEKEKESQHIHEENVRCAFPPPSRFSLLSPLSPLPEPCCMP